MKKHKNRTQFTQMMKKINHFSIFVMKKQFVKQNKLKVKSRFETLLPKSG